MVLIGDIRYDGRVRKEIGTLAGSHHVELVVSDFSQSRSGGEDLGIKIHYIPMTLWSSPAMNFYEQLSFNRKAALLLKELHPNYIHCHDLSSLLSSVWAKKRAKAKLIFDAHELMPESMGGIREKIWGRIEKTCIKSCDHIIMPEKNRIAYFKEKYPNIYEISLLENFPRRNEIPTEKADLFRNLYPIRKEQKIILYSGTVGTGRYIEELIDSMSLCTREFVLVILGRTFNNYEDLLRLRVKKLGLLDRVFFHESVPHVEVLRYMASCNIGTAFYRNTDLNNYYCASNKLYEYIALEKKVLTNNYPGLLETVGKFRQGICLTEVTPRSLAEAYILAHDRALVTPGRRKFFWEDQERTLLQVYEK
jgi:glycosyltransferase involved in cell wall biosynthesis